MLEVEVKRILGFELERIDITREMLNIAILMTFTTHPNQNWKIKSCRDAVVLFSLGIDPN